MNVKSAGIKCLTSATSKITFRTSMKSKVHRRGKRKHLKKLTKSLRFLGCNASGIRSKITTFKKVLYELQPSVFFLEETKCVNIGKLKFDQYYIFEKVRKLKTGGGLALGCDKQLKPAFVKDGGENVEALSINIFPKNMKIRCCVAYGPQESESVVDSMLNGVSLKMIMTNPLNKNAGFPRVQCEECRKNFQSERYMKTHKTRIHKKTDVVVECRGTNGEDDVDMDRGRVSEAK